MAWIKTSARRTAALLLALWAALTWSVPAWGVSVSDFTDVSSSAWYYSAVSFAVDQGLFNGTSDTTFTPNGTMKRGMFLTVLGRYAGVDPDAWKAAQVTTDQLNFRSGPGYDYDVLATLYAGDTVTLTGESGDWYEARAGGQTGYVLKEYTSPSYHRFGDVDYSAYYAGYVIWGYESGIVSGMSSTAFEPDGSVTREQICKLLYGYALHAGIQLADGGSVSFTDQDNISSWAADGVAAMQRAGVVQGVETSGGYEFRPRYRATRAEAAAIFQRFSAASSGGVPETNPTPAPTPEVTPAPPETPDINADVPFPADSPATFADGAVYVPSYTIRVGLLVNTAYYNDAVDSVSLTNWSGSGFEYGYFDYDRSFGSDGSLEADSLYVTTDGDTFTVTDGDGAVLLTGYGTLALRPLYAASEGVQLNGGYSYRGAFELRQASGAPGYISVINYVDIEDYVKGVLPYEFGNYGPFEYLKAGAVAVRSYVMAADWSIYSGYGFDVMNDTSDQVYRGRGSDGDEGYFSDTDAAADATANLYLTSGGYVAQAHYFDSDGGATESSINIWFGDVSYLTGKRDPYELSIAGEIPNWSYASTLSRSDGALSSLAASLGLDSIAPDGIRIEPYPDTGNVKSITVTAEDGSTAVIDAYSSYGRWDFLKAFGFSYLSFRFTVTYDPAADDFTCTRYGWGNQVGLSQWGAWAMARDFGKDYQTILGFYFDGTQLQYGA